MEEKEPGTRYIKLDMKKYDSSVQAYSDEDLVKIFELGLKVKESASFNLDVNQKIMEDALHETVARIDREVNENMTKLATNVESFTQNLSGHLTSITDQLAHELTSRVDGVAQNLQQALDNIDLNQMSHRYVSGVD